MLDLINLIGRSITTIHYAGGSIHKGGGWVQWVEPKFDIIIYLKVDINNKEAYALSSTGKQYYLLYDRVNLTKIELVEYCLVFKLPYYNYD